VKVGPQIGKMDAHVEMQWRLAGGLHETRAMVSRFGDRRLEIGRAVKDAVASVGETASAGIEMGEGGHDGAGARPTHTLRRRHHRNVSHFVPQAADW
jgi:hypothetical protein